MQARTPQNNGLHLPVLGWDDRCTKKIRKPENGSTVACGQGRDSMVHLYYPCLDEVCVRRFWSLETRLDHMDSSHG